MSAMHVPPILAEAPLISPTLREQLPCLAAASEEQGEAAMACGRDAQAAAYFRISEAADTLFLALVQLEEVIP